MHVDKLKDEISRLALSEQLLLIGDVWDAIAAGNNDIPVADWQKMELDRRYQEYRDGKLPTGP